MAPIHDAAKGGNLEEIKRVIQQDSQLVHRRNDVFGYTPLHWACEEGHVGVAAWLLGHGAHINEKTNGGRTACYLACERGRLAVVELLLGEGADATIPNPLLFTPLMLAVDRGHVDVVRCLLHHPQATSTINHRNVYGWTALCLACHRHKGDVGVVRLLLEAGADPAIVTNDGRGQIAMYIAKKRYHDVCVELLEEWERRYLLTKARHLRDVNHDHDVSQALAHQHPLSSSSSSTVRTKSQVHTARIKATPTYLMGRVEKGEPLPKVEVEVRGGVEGDRSVREVEEDLLVSVVLEHVVCGGLRGELFVELMEVMGRTGYRKGKKKDATAVSAPVV